MILIIPILGAGGPVEEAAKVIGGGVNGLDVQPLGHPAGDGGVLVRRHLPVGGDDPAEAGMLRGVGVRGIAGHPVLTERRRLHPRSWFGAVGVQGDHGAGDHVLRLSLPGRQGTAHEAAHDLLGRGPGLLGHGFVLSDGLGGPVDFLDPAEELGPADLLRPPALTGLSLGCRYLHGFPPLPCPARAAGPPGAHCRGCGISAAPRSRAPPFPAPPGSGASGGS